MKKISKSDGKACIDISVMDDTTQLGNCYTDNFRIRYEKIKDMFTDIIVNKEKMDAHIKEYHMEGSVLSYQICRIARLNEMYTIGLLKEYGNVLSRVGHPFDYMKVKELRQ